MNTLGAIWTVFFKKVWRERLLLIAGAPQVAVLVAYGLSAVTARQLWLYSFLFLPVAIAAITSGIVYDEFRSHNHELLLVRMNPALAVLYRLMAVTLITTAFPSAVFLVTVARHPEAFRSSLYFWAACAIFVLTCSALFTLASCFLHPRFSWLLVLAMFFLLPQWLGEWRSGTVGAVTSMILGSSAFVASFTGASLKPSMILLPLLVAILGLGGTVLCSKRPWNAMNLS